MKARSFGLVFAGTAVFAACAERTEDADRDDMAIIAGAIGNYRTPDPKNLWLKGVDPESLTRGQESLLANEDEVFESLVTRIKTFQKRLVDDGINESVIRAFHAKPQACVAGTFQVAIPDGQTRAKVGLFATNKTYPMWLRLSNGVAYFQEDKKVDVRGVAIKVMNVPGPKLNPGQESAGTQDFIMIATPTSFTTDAVSLIDFVEVAVDAKLRQHHTTELARTLLDSVPSFVPKTELADRLGALASLSGPGGYITQPGNERLLGFLVSKLIPTTFKHGSLLGERFWTQAAIAMGVEDGDPMKAQARDAMKLAVDPGVVIDLPLPGAQRMPDGKWCHSKGIEVPHVADQNFLRTDLTSRMNDRETCFVVRMQFQEHPSVQLIEDTSVEWMESESPFQTVGFIRVPRVKLGDPTLLAQEKFCNDLAFTPWHARHEHRPLGNFQRARLKVYNALAATRGAMSNPQTGALIEPKGDEMSR